MFKTGDKYEQQFIVSEDVYNGFLNTFKDNNPLHTNKEFANAKGFEDKVIHGNVLNGFLSFFIGEVLPTKDVLIQTQEIQFKSPVYLNNKLLLVVEVTGVYESVKTVEFKFSFLKENQKVAAKGKIQIGLLK